MTETHPETDAPSDVQVLRDAAGEPAFAVVPWARWAALQESLEDARDATMLDRFKADLESGREELLPIALSDAIAGGDSPIKVWREHRGLTQKALADAAGLKQAYVSELESGKKANPPIDTVRRLARALAVDVEDLFPPLVIEAEAARLGIGVTEVD